MNPLSLEGNVSSNSNPKKDSPTSNPSAQRKGAANSRKQKRRRSGSKKNANRGRDSNQIDEEAILRAKERFDRSPRAMGLPANQDPPPKEIQMTWKLSPVPRKIEREVHDIVCRPGEFGFLDDKRVDEIADLIGDRPISLEQALSLRAALNQEKAVFSHGRLQRRAREMLRKYEGGESVLSLSKRYEPFLLREIGQKIVSKKHCANRKGN